MQTIPSDKILTEVYLKKLMGAQSRTVTVCSKAYSTRALNIGPTFINMGAKYPDNPFTAVIMFEKRSGFSYKPEGYLKRKTICVTGTVKNYKGKPEIVMDGEGQVKVK